MLRAKVALSKRTPNTEPLQRSRLTDLVKIFDDAWRVEMLPIRTADVRDSRDRYGDLERRWHPESRFFANVR